MTQPLHSCLYQINTRTWLHEIAPETGSPATLDDIPDQALDRIARFGFDWVWLLGVWETGPAGREVARSDPSWRPEMEEALPDLIEDDILGSPFSIRSYTASPDYGGDEALSRLRTRLRERGIRLMLDFVPNHTALDHPWTDQHPEFYVAARDSDPDAAAGHFLELETAGSPRRLAHGRDPHFPPWPDTLQLNIRHAGCREAVRNELLSVAERCDGVRCDMAMLLLPEVFKETWGDLSLPADGSEPIDDNFWLSAIPEARRDHPEFILVAEVYWNLERALLKQGFDYAYDKSLYDLLRNQDVEWTRVHLDKQWDLLPKSVHFLENHDEPRAAAVFAPDVLRAAATVSLLSPGLRLIQEGQIRGIRRPVSVHLRRRPEEPADMGLLEFYLRLFSVLRREEVRNGHWRYLECERAWDSNPTWQHFIAFAWHGKNKERLLVCVNYSPTQAQCFVPMRAFELDRTEVLLNDLMSAASFRRDGAELAAEGLYLDMPAWGYHVFQVEEV